MGKSGSSAFNVLLADGYNLLAAKVKGVTSGYEFPTEQTDGLGDDHEEHTPVGMSRDTLVQTGAFFDDATHGMHLAFRSNAGAPRILTWAALGNTIGAAFSGALGALKTKYDVLVTMGKLTKANAAYRIDGVIDEGVILQAHAVETADGNNASVDNGASSANGGVGFLQVSQFAGLTGFVGVIEHSTDNAAWVTLITFANVTAAPSAQRIAVAGTVEQFLRFRRDVTGAGTVTPFAGFARG